MARAYGVVMLTACVFAGCALFHHRSDSAPRRFLEALQRGNGVMASQIWLHMTPAERAELSHNQGLTAALPTAEAQSQSGEAKSASADRRSDEAEAAVSLDQHGIDSTTIDLPSTGISSGLPANIQLPPGASAMKPDE